MQQRPGYTICVCPDSYLLKARLATLLAAYPSATGNSWEQYTFWGDEPIPPSFWEHMTLQGLFATSKALILRNAQNIPAESLRLLSEALLKVSPTVWPILCFEVAMERGKPKIPAHVQKLSAYAIAEKKGWIDLVPGLDEHNFSVFIREECRKLGIHLEPAEEAQLVRILPMDAQRAGAELSKLSLLTDGNGKLLKNSTSIIDKSEEFNVFALLQLIQQQKYSGVWRQILEAHAQSDSSLFAFVAILLRETRILWQILHGESPALPPYILTQKKILAQRLGKIKTAKLFDLALQADKGVKTGERSPAQAMDILISELFLLFA